MSKVDFSPISFKDLKMVVKQLNKSGLTEENLKVVGIKKDDLIQKFLETVESIPEEKESEIPDQVADMYNSIVEILEGGEQEETQEETEEEQVEDESDIEVVNEEEVGSEAEEAEEAEEEIEEEKPKKAKKAKAKTEEKKSSAKPKKAEKTSKPKKEKESKPKKAEKAEKASKPKKKGSSIKDELGAKKGSGTAEINEILMSSGGTFKEIAEKVGTKSSRVQNHIHALTKSGVIFKKEEVEQGDKLVYSFKVKTIPDNFEKAQK